MTASDRAEGVSSWNWARGLGAGIGIGVFPFARPAGWRVGSNLGVWVVRGGDAFGLVPSCRRFCLGWSVWAGAHTHRASKSTDTYQAWFGVWRRHGNRVWEPDLEPAPGPVVGVGSITMGVLPGPPSLAPWLVLAGL